MGLKPSSEMYLETIYILTKSKPFVRSIDIAEHMNYSRPSVSRGIGILKKAKYIVVDTDGYISLTDRGLLLAEKIYERHTVLSKILMMLGVDEKTAIEDACKAEHVISDRSFQALKKHAEDKQRSEKDRS
ncbi:MAG: metal-dependent transcriptional regulator [Christensenellales bacterium]